MKILAYDLTSRFPLEILIMYSENALTHKREIMSRIIHTKEDLFRYIVYDINLDSNSIRINFIFFTFVVNCVIKCMKRAELENLIIYCILKLCLL